MFPSEELVRAISADHERAFHAASLSGLPLLPQETDGGVTPSGGRSGGWWRALRRSYGGSASQRRRNVGQVAGPAR